MVLLVSIATLLAGLAVAGGAAAQEITGIQSYTWTEEGDSTSLAEDHTWNPVSAGDSSEWREVPADGFALVNVTYTGADSISTIDFRYVVDSEFNDDNPTEYEYTYEINEAGDGHADVDPGEQNVFLARNVTAVLSGNSDAESLGPDGCMGNLDESGDGLKNGTPEPQGCFFLIELGNEENGADITSDLSTDLTLEVDVGTTTEEERADDDSGRRSVQAVDQDLSIDNLEFTSGTLTDESAIDGPTIEAGVSLELNLTLQTGNSGDSSRSTSNGDGDVDAWVCLFEEGEADEPYANYAHFVGNAEASHEDGPADHVWDDPVACRVMDFPADHETVDAERNHATSMGTAIRNHTDRQSASDTGLRYFEQTFNIPRSDVEIENGDFVDTFDVTVVARDAIGNFLTAGHEDSNQNDGPYTVAHMEIGQDPVSIGVNTTQEDVLLSDFTQNDGCLQLEDPSKETRWDADDKRDSNTDTNPCFRSLNHAPPDQPFEIPILVENYANVPDEIEVSWSDAGGEDWNVELVGPTDSGSTITEQVPAAETSVEERAGAWKENIDDPATVPVTLRITPNPSSTADIAEPGDDPSGSTGFMTVETRTDSTYTGLPSGNDSVRDEWYEQAKLVQNAKGTIDFGTDRETAVTVDAQAQQEETIDLTIDNTGNTDGPFEVTVDQDESPSQCGSEVNTDNPSDDEIDFRLTDPDQAGAEVGAVTIGPAEDPETYDLEIEVGPNVAIDEYNCRFAFEPQFEDSDDDDVTLDPPSLDPTVTVNVTGTPDIRIWDTQAPNRQQVNVTGEEIQRTILPGNGEERIFLFLENVGDVGLEPELDTDSGWPVDDRHSLHDRAKWFGVDLPDDGDDQEDTVSLATAENTFALPLSDTDETEDVLVRDLFPDDDAWRTNTSDPIPDAGGDLWDCAGQDDDNDGDDRAVCRLVFEYDYSNAVIGDEVTYRFTWEDPQETEQESTVDVTLEVGYPGEIEATDVTQSVIDDSDTSTGTTTITFDGELDEDNRFDLTQTSDVDANVTVSYDDPEHVDTVTCWGALASTQEDESSARFRPDVEVGTPGNAPCLVEGGTITLDDSVGASLAGISLNVTDENDTLLRQVTPAFVHLVSDAEQPDGVSSEALDPSGTLQATGKQHVTYTFNHPSHDPANGNFFPDGDDEGVVLYRTADDEDTDAFEPYSELGLNTEATSVSQDGDRQWTRSLPSFYESGTYEDPEYNGDQRINASDDQARPGTLFRENNDNEPIRVGDVNLTGWSEDSEITWTEGWNPVTFRVTDQQGDPLEDNLDANDFEVTLKLVARNETDGNITDTYELSTNQDTIVTRYLGNGHLAADIYLPAGLNQTDLDAASEERYEDDPGFLLADHPMDESATVEMEAWALHLELQSGQSTDGQDLDGDAYWRAADLGLADDSGLAAPEQNGTGGASQIVDTGPSALETTLLDEDPTGTGDTEEILHLMSKFQNGPIVPDGTWETGPGIHDYQVFLLEERDDQQSSSRTIDDEETAGDVHEHTFQPFSNADVELEIVSAARGEDTPGAGTTELDENGTVQGQFGAFFGLPDTGSDTTWISQVTVFENDVSIVSTDAKQIDVDERRQASTQALPMPLAFDDERLFRTEEGLGDNIIFDTRSVPGLVPDRGHFGIAAASTHTGNSDVGFLLELNDAGDTIFEVEGEGLLTIPSDNLPTTGEVDRPIKLTGDRAVSPTPASAVASVEAELLLDGDHQGSTQLTDSGGNEWTGSVTPTQQGDHRLVIRATDTAGGVSTVGSTVNVSADAPPEITIDAPSETEGVRAMTSDGTIQATVLDSSIVASDVTYEEKIGSDGDGPSVLTAENASFDSLRDSEENDSSPFSVTLTLNQTEGNAWLNVTDVDGSEPSDAFNSTIDGTSFSDGEVSGTLWMNETGTVTLTVQTNGTVDETFTVDVVENIGSGFTEVSLGNDLTCEAAECSISYSPGGLSDGDTYQFEITADVAGQSESSGPHEVVVDDQSPSVDLSIGSPSVSGTPTIVGPSTSVTVTATDNVPGDVDGGVVDQLTVSGVRAGTTTGSTDVSAGDTVDMDQLGLGSEGSGTIQANVTDLAGNQDTASVDVQVDASGPSISNADLSTSAGDLVVQATVTDDAGIDRVRLFHKGPSATTFSSKEMSAAGDDTFEASVSDPGSAGLFEYYITARDRFDNEDRLRSQNNPFTQDLGEIDFENSAPEVTIVAPSDGETVSGAINVTIEASDPDEDSLEIPDLQATVTDNGSTTSIPFDGGLTDGAATVRLDTGQFPDGRVELEASVTDGLESASDTVTVIVENRPTPTSCPDADGELTAGDSVDVCFTYGTPANVTELNVALVRNGETVDEVTLDPREDGAYRATFEIPEEGTYVLQITATTEDGGTQELTTDTFSVGVPAGPGDQPLGRFVTTLVLGVAVVGLSAFAAFGRWG